MVLSMWHWLLQIFFTSKFTFFFFLGNPTPTNWNWFSSGQQIGGGTTNSKPPGLIKVRSNLLHSFFFCRCRASLDLLPVAATCTVILSQKPIFLRQTSIFGTFFFIQFYCEGSHTESHWAPLEILRVIVGIVISRGTIIFGLGEPDLVFWEDIYNV